VAVDELLECCLVAAGDETIQQFGISDLGNFSLEGDLVEVVDNALKLTGRHGIPPGS
jgi:hypothetical protein